MKMYIVFGRLDFLIVDRKNEDENEFENSW